MRIRMVGVLVFALIATDGLVVGQAPVGAEPAKSTGGSAGQSASGSSSTVDSSSNKSLSAVATNGPRPVLASVTDPACPVTVGVAPQPVAKDLRVLYFPMGIQAAIPDPKALNLHIAFDDGSFRDDVRTAAFAKREDGAWEALLTLHSQNRYAIYWVEEPETKRVDTNGGAYFEVLFCDARGERLESTIGYRARTYDGWLESRGFERAANFSKALEILGDYIHPPERGGTLFFWWWYFKDLQGKQTPEARAALVAEMRQFVREHEADKFGYSGTFDFAEFADWVPLELGEHLADALQKNYSAEWDPHVDLLVSRASHEKDEAKRFSELREIIARYPENIHADEARMTLFLDSKDLGEREKLYALLSTKRHGEVSLRLGMVQAYLDAGTRYGIALALLDDAEKLCDERLKDPRANDYARRYAKDEKGAAAVMRAEILIRTGKPKDALAILLPRKGEFKRGHSFYVLGTALEKTGKRRDAIDAYLRATVIVGPDQKKADDAMERLWIKGKMGTKEELRSRVEQESVKAFEHAAYEPRLVSREAPELDLTTTGGEHFTSASLRGKAVVLDFWATWCGSCVFELKGLEDFQAKHPEAVVLTVVEDDTETKDLEQVLKERQATGLRVSKVPAKMFAEFGAVGVPHTFVIDESGKVRMHHFGGMEDVVRELEADLGAIRDAGTGR
jgi:cytochrome c biogenesis protein CcmG/thiol:disulfide interchange protein DsbE